MNNDAVSIAPHLHTIIFENEKVRALEVVVKPGDKAEMHTHPDNVLTVISGGTLTMTNPQGESREVVLETGKTFFSAATEHAVENKSDKTVKVVQIELKL